MTFQGRTIIVACWLACLCCGAIASLTPTYLPILASAFSTAEGGVVDPVSLGGISQALFLCGWVAGGVLFGYLADRYGRVRIVGLALLVAIGSMLVSAFVGTHTTYYLVRLSAGIGSGGVMAVATTFVAESLSARSRPLMMGLFANSYAVGIVSTGIMQATGMTYSGAAYVLSSFIVIVGILTLLRPDAPVLHVHSMHGEQQPFLTTLRAHRREIVLASLLFGSMLIGLWSAFTWLPSWVSELAPKESAGSVRGFAMMSLGLGGIIGSVLMGVLVQRIGRIATLTITYGSVLVLSLWLYGTTQTSSQTVLIGLSCLAVFFGMSQGLLSFYIPELFPARIRATCVGVCFNVGRLMTAVAVFNLGTVADFFSGIQQALLCFALIIIIGIAVVPLLRPAKLTM
ncbi:MAG: MFS transporter [Candidatus Kapabacteria bacterium]|nr:MFS transporter [Candidatus Kapabacteria bacterium]